MSATTEDFTQSFDARDWAKAFVEHVQQNPGIATDEDTMLGWFANALMRGWDEHERRSRAVPPTEEPTDLASAVRSYFAGGPMPENIAEALKDD